MRDAVTGYATHRASDDRWALGRFVVPRVRVPDLVAAVGAQGVTDLPWPVSVVGDAADFADAAALDRERTSLAPTLAIESVEARAGTVADVEALGAVVDRGVEVFAEVGMAGGFEARMAAVAQTGAAAKIRTGGTVAEAFPSPQSVLRFLRTCRAVGVRFKATAGLHHPLRGEYALTYEAGAVRGTMYGYLNVFVAAALVWSGCDDETVLAVLEERDPAAFAPDESGLAWRQVHLATSLLHEVRARFIAGFGSCSFREPLDEAPRALVAA